MFSPLRWQDDRLQLLDQTRLPAKEVWLACTTPQHVAQAIRRLAVRGAPAIGVAAAYGLVLGAERFDEAAELLASTRPTAVNLRWAIERGRAVFERTRSAGPQATRDALLTWAHALQQQDAEDNRRLGQFGAALFADGDRVLTHCNAGSLATAGYGTALGVIRAAWEGGKRVRVWVDETRPLLQGARLTAWELQRQNIPFDVVTDNSVGALMARGLVDRVVVGADRIAVNGDVANKIGTYTVAVLAERHGVPFYVAAPRSTLDRACATGEAIPIEERDPREVTHILGQAATPTGATALNLAFDVTPHELVSAIITEVGVLDPPYSEAIVRALDQSVR